MSVKNLNEQKLKRRLLSLMSEFNALYQQKQPSHHFKSICVFDNYQLYVSEFLIKKIDQQVTRNNDFMIIHDIKYKRDELSISYTSQHDYDELIETLDCKG
ncbi:hypothetical protein [Aliiglaciecola sp. LCG003]|uniref:hypothetical protein n=1 Tax=Aliiglaciecola sp. LCG003 TaxID=3053655 RepID=UPI0025739B26|nr:hypothetical protein [Aliiglaciecola sp. LCG003]WJG07717.1 hypothetical protein QR722_10095 [Aliiglaciecola sp. LCG003]